MWECLCLAFQLASRCALAQVIAEGSLPRAPPMVVHRIDQDRQDALPQAALDLGPVAIEKAKPESEEVVGDPIGAPPRATAGQPFSKTALTLGRASAAQCQSHTSSYASRSTWIDPVQEHFRSRGTVFT